MRTKKLFKLISVLIFLSTSFFVNAQSVVNLDANEVRAKASLFLSPATGSFLVDSTFDVSIMVNTHGSSVNTIEANLKFPPDKLQIVKPTSGKSIISLWLDQPRYSNADGTSNFAGGILGGNGINTSSGVISTITFRVIGTGKAIIQFLPTSKVLAGDGLGTDVTSDFGTGVYDLSPRPPQGPLVFSETHPFQDTWYNNNNPIISWQKDPGVTDFSYVLDKNPATVPDNVSEAQQTSTSFENLTDGIWYFHVKAKKSSVWGGASHFLVRIDTTPPAGFNPIAEVIIGKVFKKAIVSFLTTDAASGIDHYEAATIKRSEAVGGSPVFIEAQSPYELPKSVSGDVIVIMRAIDKAGNVRDESVNVRIEIPIFQFILNNIVIILLIIIGLLSALSTEHFLFTHRIVSRLKLIWGILRGRKNLYEEKDGIHRDVNFLENNNEEK